MPSPRQEALPAEREGPGRASRDAFATPRPLISVCVVAGHSREALGAFAASLAEQSDPPPFELLVADSAHAGARQVVRRHFPDARIWDTRDRLPGSARNPLIENARGDLLLFLDDDVTARPNLLAELARMAADEPEASVFGGPNETPPGSSRFQVVQGAVLGSLVGAGPVSRRYGARHPGPADERWFTLCNLAVRREAMRPFADDLVCAEENAVLGELSRRGETMRYEPSLMVFHQRRDGPRSFARQMFKYGWGRGALMRRDPSAVQAAYLAPAGLIAYAMALATLSSLRTRAAAGPGVLYAALLAANSIRIARTLRRSGDAPRAAALTLLLHMSYGSGVIRGLLRPARAKRARGRLG